MKLTFKHTALSLALAGSFALTGCNFIGDGDAVFTDPVVEQVAVSGAAVKGVLRNAKVKAYKLADSSETDLTDGTVRTSATDGSYTVNLEGINEPVVIEVSSDAQTSMICDSASGCGDFAFEAEVPATSAILNGIVLSTVIAAGGSSEVSAPVNTFTSIATETIKLDSDITSNATLNSRKKAVQAQVLSLIGISNDESIDLFSTAIVDATGVSGVSNATLKSLSAFNGALAATSNTGNIGTKVSNLVATIKQANEQGQDITQQTKDTIAQLVSEIREEIVKIIQKEEPEAEIPTFPPVKFPDNTEVNPTGTGTGTGSGSNSGGIN